MRIAKRNLKKQSQFAAVKIGVTSYAKGVYGNKPGSGAGKNKAKQNQFRGLENATEC